MTEQAGQAGAAAPRTARECAELALAKVLEDGVYGTHAVDEAAALIERYADAALAERDAEVERLRGALERWTRMKDVPAGDYEDIYGVLGYAEALDAFDEAARAALAAAPGGTQGGS